MMIENIHKKHPSLFSLKLAANIFVAINILVSCLVSYWTLSYVIQHVKADVTSVEILENGTNRERTEYIGENQVAHTGDTITIFLQFYNLSESSFRSNEIIIDCDKSEYTIHSSVKQIRTVSDEKNVYGVSYVVPNISCEGVGTAFTRVEIVNRFNPFMTMFPMIVDSDRVTIDFQK